MSSLNILMFIGQWTINCSKYRGSNNNRGDGRESISWFPCGQGINVIWDIPDQSKKSNLIVVAGRAERSNLFNERQLGYSPRHGRWETYGNLQPPFTTGRLLLQIKEDVHFEFWKLQVFMCARFGRLLPVDRTSLAHRRVDTELEEKETLSLFIATLTLRIPTHRSLNKRCWLLSKLVCLISIHVQKEKKKKRKWGKGLMKLFVVHSSKNCGLFALEVILQFVY